MSEESLGAATGVAAPLRGKRIIEVGGRMVGYAGRLLADLGADVIVLERPAGEEARHVPPFATSASGDRISLDHEYRQQSKRSVSVDWTSAEALPLLRRIGASADAVLVTSRPGRAVVGLSAGPTLDWAGERRRGVRGHRLRADGAAKALASDTLHGLRRQWADVGDRTGRGPAPGHAWSAHVRPRRGTRRVPRAGVVAVWA